MPGRPSADPASYSSASTASAATLSWTHTGATGEAIYAVVMSNMNGQGLTPLPTMTYDGVDMTPLIQFAYLGGGSGWAFSLPASLVTAGALTIQFSISIATTLIGQACNVANAPADACGLLCGGYVQTHVTGTTFTRNAYGWDALGLQLGAVSVFAFSNGITLSGGTTVGTTTGAALSSFDCVDDLVQWDVSTGAMGGFSMELLSWMIPPDETTQPRTGGGFQPWFTDRVPVQGATGVFNESALPWGSESTVYRAGGILMIPGTAHSWVVSCSAAPGVGNSVTAEIYRGGALGETVGEFAIPTGITLTISGTATEASRTDLAALLSWPKYERLIVRYTITNTAGYAGADFWSSFLIESGEDNAQIYGGGAQTIGGGIIPDVAFYKGPLHPLDDRPWESTADDEKSLCGIVCTQTELLVVRQGPTALTDDHQFYMEKRAFATPLVAVLQDGSGGSVDTTATYPNDALGTKIARSTFSLSWGVGDLMGVVGYMRTLGAQTRHSAAIKVVASVAGEMLLSGHSAESVAPSTYVAVPNAPIGAGGTEAVSALTIPPMTAAGADFHILGLIEYLELTGPDTGTFTTRLRKNLANTSMPDLVMTGSPAAPLYGNTGGDVAYTGLDTLSQQFIPASSPTLQRQFWSYVGFVSSVGPAPTTQTYGIRRLRRSPHLSHEQMWQFFSLLQLDIQAGVGLTTGQGSDPQLMLRFSDDGGFTWSNEHWVSAGKIGEYTRRAIWRRLGRGRDRVFEVTMTDPVFWALLEAEIQATRGTS